MGGLLKLDCGGGKKEGEGGKGREGELAYSVNGIGEIGGVWDVMHAEVEVAVAVSGRPQEAK